MTVICKLIPFRVVEDLISCVSVGKPGKPFRNYATPRVSHPESMSKSTGKVTCLFDKTCQLETSPMMSLECFGEGKEGVVCTTPFAYNDEDQKAERLFM